MLWPWWLGGYILTVLLALVLRTKAYAAFVGVMLGIQVAIWFALFAGDDPWAIAALPLQLAVYIHFLSLVHARMRPLWWRITITWPALWFASGTLLALPWAVVVPFGVEPFGWQLAFLIAAFGFYESLTARKETVIIGLDGQNTGALQRLSVHRRPGQSTSGQGLRILQLTDMHVGPFMSEHRLRSVCRRGVATKPDLIVITGDFVTMESHHAVDLMARALAPIRESGIPCFACHGNHDLECRETVAELCRRTGIRLLVDEEARIQTPIGELSIIGADFRFRYRERHLAGLVKNYPRKDEVLRLWLLHDPGAFRDFPETGGHGDLVLSGHTHGGQLGLVTLGLNWTLLGQFSAIPDHGLWGRGSDRLYVHRGNGHYGFPLRIGVPAEESILEVRLSGEDIP